MVGFMRLLGGSLMISSQNTYVAWHLPTIPQILITVPGKQMLLFGKNHQMDQDSIEQ